MLCVCVQGLMRSSRFRASTLLYLPWTPQVKPDLTEYFSGLKVAPDRRRDMCLFVSNGNDSISDVSHLLDVSATDLLKANFGLVDPVIQVG